MRQVLVPAAVTDKKGHTVSGLKEPDFVVFEDEKPQRIVAFRKTYDASLETTGLPAVGKAAARSAGMARFRSRIGFAGARIWSA